jgi:hypothetical protein
VLDQINRNKTPVVHPEMRVKLPQEGFLTDRAPLNLNLFGEPCGFM